MKEKDYQRKLVKFLKEHNALVMNFIGNVYQSGVPDLFVAHRRWSGWLELKGPRTTITEQQKYNLTELRRHGQWAYVLRFVGDPMSLQKLILSNADESWKVCFPSFITLWEYLVESNKS